MSQIPSANQSAASIVDTIHSIAATHESMEVSVGKVINPPPEIKVAWNDIILERAQLYIDSFLLKNYYREIRGHIKSGTQMADCGCGGQHAHGIDNPYEATLYTVDTLKVGDLVTVLPLKGGQQFIILGKLLRI